MKRSQSWIYHKTEKSKIVYEDEAENYYEQGWADTPAAFLGIKHQDSEDKDPKQPEEDSIESLKTFLNKALDLENMSWPQLREFASKYFDKTFVYQTKKEKLIEKIKKLVEDKKKILKEKEGNLNNDNRS